MHHIQRGPDFVGDVPHEDLLQGHGLRGRDGAHADLSPRQHCHQHREARPQQGQAGVGGLFVRQQVDKHGAREQHDCGGQEDGAAVLAGGEVLLGGQLGQHHGGGPAAGQRQQRRHGYPQEYIRCGVQRRHVEVVGVELQQLRGDQGPRRGPRQLEGSQGEPLQLSGHSVEDQECGSHQPPIAATQVQRRHEGIRTTREKDETGKS
mmetsp:Transcript_4586/g.6273  ORF Transcript_4586/g.6273 Transcript_4586/m.6273 type:complete len:206 (+) Transcript_4586:1751-2368(+)